jgi:creatinine amidohydrolase
MDGPVQFSELSSPQAGALPAAGSRPVLLLPVGAVEPHGPHAPLGTDTIISTTVCDRAARELAGGAGASVLVLPAVAYGVTRYGAAFPGAVGISEATLESLVTEICSELREDGFRRVIIVNSHFEPEHVAALRRAAAAANAVLFDLTRRRLAERLTDEFRSGAAHAGRYETSLVLASRPELVDADRMRAMPALPVNMPAAIADGKTDFVAMGMVEAYCGAPAEATAAEGEATLITLTAMLMETIRELCAR